MTMEVEPKKTRTEADALYGAGLGIALGLMFGVAAGYLLGGTQAFNACDSAKREVTRPVQKAPDSKPTIVIPDVR